MSHKGTTKTAELSAFERLVPELIVEIFSALPDLNPILHLCLASRRFHAILSENESAIARGFALKILGYNNPPVLKLAFMACEACMLDRLGGDTSKGEDGISKDDNSSDGNSDSYNGNYDSSAGDGASKFIDKFVYKGFGPSKLYQLRSLRLMPKISMAIELFVDWIGLYGTIYPLRLENKFLTYTEAMRLRRMLYAFEVFVTLFESLEFTLSTKKLGRLARKFWLNFSGREADLFGFMPCLIGLSNAWGYKLISIAWSSYCLITNGYLYVRNGVNQLVAFITGKIGHGILIRNSGGY
ncbi:hypothetical protein GGR53DRAFT_532883 [Hypoxylon sp. FL1150]|nr:hypothetical protein GGR53DRAFT_532883 [Hypoxylon sp. FL1150]